ncbi:MAG TPA: hypothetical protein VFV50_00605 [Bdellovibrionales bacterium]|nr:hypothetical protein [Bdellovibrionales bacterium]
MRKIKLVAFALILVAGTAATASTGPRIVCESSTRGSRFTLIPERKFVEWSYSAYNGQIVRIKLKPSLYEAGELPYQYRVAGCAPYNADEVCYKISLSGLRSQNGNLSALVTSRGARESSRYECLVARH